MEFVKKLEFGNYTLNFGESKVLLDLFDQVVMPSFFEMKYIRKFKGNVEYFFLDTKLIILAVIPHLILLFSVLDGDRPF
ncbi:hypothetical protein ACK3YN_19755 [Aeromonas caviae]